jgi:diguanylate cyclase (GGDEF)-like protein
MSSTSASKWQFSHKVMVPVLLAIAVTMAALAGFVVWSTSRTDEHALARETALVANALVDQLDSMPRIQVDLAVWDEALDAVARRDTGWLDENLGAGLYEVYGQERSYVLDAGLHPVFAMRDGGRVPAKAFESVRATILPLIDKLRSLDGIAATAAYNNGANDTAPSATDIALLDGHAAMVSVMPMLSDSGDMTELEGSEPIYISAMLLGEPLATTLKDQYLFNGAHFDTMPDLADAEAVYPVRNNAGETIAWFKWQPDRPGARILQDTLPALLGAFAIAGVIIALLLRNLLRASTQLQAERAEAQHRALHDPLTGLGNRALFLDRLHQAVNAMSRGEPRLALLTLDLDRFKQVNDTLGHEAGDELLRQVAGRITSMLRSGDTLVRLGGDEFAIIQTDIITHADATGLAQRVIDALQAPFHLSGKSIQIGVSIGIVTAPDLAQTEAELASRADDALYSAKAGGRNRFCLHAPQANEPARLEEEIRQAFSVRVRNSDAA